MLVWNSSSMRRQSKSDEFWNLKDILGIWNLQNAKNRLFGSAYGVLATLIAVMLTTDLLVGGGEGGERQVVLGHRTHAACLDSYLLPLCISFHQGPARLTQRERQDVGG